MAHLNISIVGSGRRSHRVAEHLRARGHRLAVHDPTRHVDLLAGVNLLPADVADGADLLVLDVAEGRLYDDAVYQVGGVCEALPTGASVLDLSPQGPSAARIASDTLAKYGITYADGLLLNFLGRRPGYEPTLVASAAAADNPAYGALTAAIGARTISIGSTGSANLARLVLEDAYEMAIRFIGEADNGEHPCALDDVAVDPATLTAVTTIVGGWQRGTPLHLDAAAA